MPLLSLAILYCSGERRTNEIWINMLRNKPTEKRTAQTRHPRCAFFGKLKRFPEADKKGRYLLALATSWYSE